MMTNQMRLQKFFLANGLTNMTSKTPKTDAQFYGREYLPAEPLVTARFARKLELENAVMREAIKLSSSAFARTLHLLEHVPATREMEILCSGAEEDIRSAILKLEPLLK